MSVPFKQKLGLSLSAGGYRAAEFHLGTLKKLYEIGLLKKVDVLSTILGGSITGACYCLHTENFGKFYTEMYQALHKCYR
jgi:NTE family protein